MPEYETTCPRCAQDFDVASDAREAHCPACGAWLSFSQGRPAPRTPARRDAAGGAAQDGSADPGARATPPPAPSGPPSARQRFLTRPERTAGDGVGRAVEDLEGVGPKFARKLEKAGVYTTDQLLWADGDDLAARTGLRRKDIRKWQDMSDLLHLRGIGPQYAEVLVRCDVNSVNELAQERPEALTKRIRERLEALDVTVTGGAIGKARVAAWIETARQMRPQPRDPAEVALERVQDEPDGPQNPVITAAGVVEAATFGGRSFPTDCPRCEATILVAEDASQGSCPVCDMALEFENVTRAQLLAMGEVDGADLAEAARHDAQRGFLDRFRKQRQEQVRPVEVSGAPEPSKEELFRRRGGAGRP